MNEPEKIETPIADLERIEEAACARCKARLCAHHALFSLAMGFKSTPHCSRCLAAALERDERDLRDQIPRLHPQPTLLSRGLGVGGQAGMRPPLRAPRMPLACARRRRVGRRRPRLRERAAASSPRASRPDGARPDPGDPFDGDLRGRGPPGMVSDDGKRTRARGSRGRHALLPRLQGVAVGAREEGYKNREYEAHGFGDLTLGGRYWLLEPDLTGWNFFGEIGVRFPTGQDDRKIGTEWKKSYIQPGLGQWGIPIRAGFTKGVGDFAFMGSLGYAPNLGENDADNYESGDARHASLGGSWTPLKLGEEEKYRVGLSLFFSGIWIPERDKRNGVMVDTTGGSWYYAAPGLFFSPDGGNSSAYFSVPITLYADVNSLQCYEDVSCQLGVQFRF